MSAGYGSDHAFTVHSPHGDWEVIVSMYAHDAMGIGWMGWDEIREAVPPAYTEFIGHQLAGWLLTAPGRELAEAAA